MQISVQTSSNLPCHVGGKIQTYDGEANVTVTDDGLCCDAYLIDSLGGNVSGYEIELGTAPLITKMSRDDYCCRLGSPQSGSENSVQRSQEG